MAEIQAELAPEPSTETADAITLAYGHSVWPIKPGAEGLRGIDHSVDGWRQFADAAGYDNGLEWTPFRFSKLWRDIQSQVAEGTFQNIQDGRPLISSFHQTWRDDTGRSALRDVIRNPRANPPLRIGRRLAIMALQQRNMDSLPFISAAEETISPDRSLPVVVYPTIDNGTVDYTDMPFPDRWFQPTAEVWDTWQVSSVTAMEEEMAVHGLTGTVVDLLHIRRQFPGQQHCAELPAWQEFIPELASRGMIREMHIGAGRVDVTAPGSDLRHQTQHELSSLLLPNPDKFAATDLAAMIRTTVAAYRSQPNTDGPLPAVTEIPPLAIKQLDMTLSEAHHAITTNIRAVAETA